MFVTVHIKKWGIRLLCGLLIAGTLVFSTLALLPPAAPEQPPSVPPPPPEPTASTEPAPSPTPKEYIKWVDFDISSDILAKAMQLDIDSHDTDVPLNWIELLACLACQYGGDFSRYREKDLSELAERLNQGESMESITDKWKHYSYYLEAYTAIFAEFVGTYSVEVEDEDGQRVWKERYGLKAFSPIASGFGFGHYEDFGTGRSYGYQRKHLGHDLMGNVGTPIVAIESGIVEAVGWNQYGGWRIGIRSFDQKRYYYYAHLRKGHPYHKELQQGSVVKAGDVIGYLGMTGYSAKEDVNNIDTPHLHFGLQLIFDESQKDGTNQIWIDLYDITNLLQTHKSAVYKNQEEKEYYRLYDYYEEALGGDPPYLQPSE